MTPHLSAPLEWFLRLTGLDPIDILTFCAAVSVLVVLAWVAQIVRPR